MAATESARALTQREELGVASRAKILEAASGLFSERGFAGTSISAVSKASGLPSSSIYWHFDSKEGLLAAVVEEGAKRWFDGLPQWDDLKGTPQEQISQMVQATIEALGAHPEFLRLLFLIALERREIDAFSLDTIRRVRDEARANVERAISAILNANGYGGREELAGEMAVLALAMIDGIFLQSHIEPDQTDMARLFELAQVALLGLGEHMIRSLESGEKLT